MVFKGISGKYISFVKDKPYEEILYMVFSVLPRLVLDYIYHISRK